MEEGKKTWIYRLTHYKNLPCILDNGLHCPTSTVKCLDYINIGFKELLASVDWVLHENSEETISLEQAINAIQNWSPRKKQLMQSKHIEVAYKRLLATA